MKQHSLSSRFLSIALGAGIGGTFLGLGMGVATAALLGSSVFSDVTRGSFYDAAIGELHADGIIKGYEDGTFGPNDNVTRGQVAVMLQRFKDVYIDGNAVATSSARSQSSSLAASSQPANPHGLFRFTASTAAVSETYGDLTVTVIRSGGEQGSASVRYTTVDGTAEAGTDYTATSGTLNFANGESSKTFKVRITNDSRSEGSEAFVLRLSDATGEAGIGSPSELTYTIIDDEKSTTSSSSASSQGSSGSSTSGTSTTKGTLQFAATGYTVNENIGSVQIQVVRTGGTNGTVSVQYATANDDAKSGTEYTQTSGTLTFAQGETVQSFNVNIADDDKIDGSKTFKVVLSNVTGGATLGVAEASVFINDNDNTYVSFGTGSFKLQKSAYDVGENDEGIDITVLRTGGTLGTASVSYGTTASTAISGNDYTTVSGVLTFAPGESAKVIHIPIVNDSDSELEEYFSFSISNVTNGATIISPSSTTITIYD